MGICLATTSGKGGTGKSTVAAGLSFAFAALGKSVLLIDLDEGLRCLDLMLGIDDEIVFDLADIANGKSISDATYQFAKDSNISIIPAPSTLGSITPEKLAEVASEVKKQYDVVIFDFPAGVDFSLYSALGDNVQFLAVCNPDPVSVRDAAMVCAKLPQLRIEPRLIINRFKLEYIKNGIYSNVDDIIDISGLRLLGIIPQDDELLFLSISHRLKKRGHAKRALMRIARRILGEDVKLCRFKKI